MIPTLMYPKCLESIVDTCVQLTVIFKIRFEERTLKEHRALKLRYLLLHLPVAGCKQETYSVNLLSKAFRSVI